jgi:predicted transcriptional regulator
VNRKAALAVILIALTLSISCVAIAVAHSQFLGLSAVPDANGTQRLGFTLSLTLSAGLHGNSTSTLNQPTRLEIYTFLKNNPGIHFRGICDGLGLSVGVVQHHLYVLEHAGLVTVYTDGQNKRYFESHTYTPSQMTLFSLLRHKTAAKILTTLIQNGEVLHRDVAKSTGISSQALTWQMNQLKKTGLINAEKEGVNVKYQLSEASTNTLRLMLKIEKNSV